jgi:outer membrane lipoprotein-sorting protein
MRPLLLSILASPALFTTFAGAYALPPAIGDLAVNSVRDLQASVKVAHADLGQLEKINKDFGLLYRLREVTLRFKEPDKFRMESRLGVMVVNGPIRYLRVPQLGIKKRDDVGQSLARRHSLLDLGLVTTARLDQFTARYLRGEVISGRVCLVFELAFVDAQTGDGGNKARDRHHVWIDTERKVVLRRRWLDGEGELRAAFDYMAPTEVAPGVWLPTRIEVRNGDGALAGATTYTDIKINQSPPDALFSTEDARPGTPP